MESVHRHYAVWRAMESLVFEAEKQLLQLLRAGRKPEPELIRVGSFAPSRVIC